MKRPQITEKEFLTKLHKMYAEAKKEANGSIWITIKQENRYRPKFNQKEKPFVEPIAQPDCFIRAKRGKERLAVVVPSHRINSFHVNLSKLIDFHTRPKPKRKPKGTGKR